MWVPHYLNKWHRYGRYKVTCPSLVYGDALNHKYQKSISAKELQRQLGLKRYQPAWEMLHKLRMIMGKRDACYEMEDYVEVDEGFFGVVSEKKIDPLEIADDKGRDYQKRGRGSEKKAKVLVMVESEPVAQESILSKHKPQRKVRHAEMFQMEDLKAQTIEKEITEHVDPKSEIKTDGFRSYSRLKDKVKKHEQVTASGKNATKELPWVHLVISNAKRLFLGIHHMIKESYLQNYLNEFCYKFNRRYMYIKLFDRLLVASISCNGYYPLCKLADSNCLQTYTLSFVYLQRTYTFDVKSTITFGF